MLQSSHDDDVAIPSTSCLLVVIVILTTMMSSDHGNSKDLQLVLALGIVSYSVVKQLSQGSTSSGRKRRDELRKKISRSRPNPRSPRAVYFHQQRALDSIYSDFLILSIVTSLTRLHFLHRPSKISLGSPGPEYNLSCKLWLHQESTTIPLQ
jgi:hypothetical protein